MPKPVIAVFSGPTATVQNSEALVTSNKARRKYGLPLLTNPDGSPIRFDAVRPQRLAAPVTVYVEQFSGHPLERDAADLYGPPDGYLDASGAFHTERQSETDRPVYEVTLEPEDGLYWLPYMARQRDGQPWDSECAFPLAPAAHARQTFYPDASRILEEIDRIGLDEHGHANILSSKADFAFFRAAPSGGYKQGLPAELRTDVGEGDIAPETMSEDFWAYRPAHLRAEPPMGALAKLTNVVQRALATGQYDGAIWLEGSPSVDETTYWLNLLIDTPVPICGNSSQRPHGALSNDGDRNIVDSVDYVLSGIWRGEDGRDTVGAVLIVDEMIFASRDVQKADARPGGYTTTGGHGGVCGSIGQPGPPVLTYRPARRHTYQSAIKLTSLPTIVDGVHGQSGRIEVVPVLVKDEAGDLLPDAIPAVTFVKSGRYQPAVGLGNEPEIELLARIEKNLSEAPLAGFVAEGSAPFGGLTAGIEAALLRAVCSGMPVVKVGRGNAEGMVPRNPPYLYISGSNLTANKARLLLMAAMLKLGALPPAADPSTPTPAELAAIKAKLDQYQEVFDTH
jgi:hypothetical protein